MHVLIQLICWAHHQALSLTTIYHQPRAPLGENDGLNDMELVYNT